MGGVCGYAYSGNIIVNCYSLGQVSGSQWTGGVCGYNAGTIENCYFNSTAYAGNGIGKDSNGIVVNVLGKAVERFSNGEVTYLLSQGCTVNDVAYEGSIWGQNLESDNYPVFSEVKVYCNATYID